ncbi:MAG: hypothetical protein HOP09_09920 [Hyphomicrobium sp.]|nr:hypothetical protein [Hyphomicrobium sp.]
MLEFDFASAMQARPNRDPATASELWQWAANNNVNVMGSRFPNALLEYWPSRAVAEPGKSAPSAWIAAAGYCVRPDVKDAIEKLAPGVHQFIPLTLEAGPKGRRKEYPYFSLHIADRADDVIVEKSNVQWIKSKLGTYWSKSYDSPLALPAASVAGKHIWWNLSCGIVLISGELHNLMLDRGLTSGVKFQKQIIDFESTGSQGAGLLQ